MQQLSSQLPAVAACFRVQTHLVTVLACELRYRDLLRADAALKLRVLVSDVGGELKDDDSPRDLAGSNSSPLDERVQLLHPVLQGRSLVVSGSQDALVLDAQIVAVQTGAVSTAQASNREQCKAMEVQRSKCSSYGVYVCLLITGCYVSATTNTRAQRLPAPFVCLQRFPFLPNQVPSPFRPSPASIHGLPASKSAPP